MNEFNRFKINILADTIDNKLLIERLECVDLIADDNYAGTFFTKAIGTEIRGGDLDGIAYEEASLELAKQLLDKSVLTLEEIPLSSISVDGLKYYKRIFSLKHLIYSESKTLKQNDMLVKKITNIESKHNSIIKNLNNSIKQSDNALKQMHNSLAEQVQYNLAFKDTKYYWMFIIVILIIALYLK